MKLHVLIFVICSVCIASVAIRFAFKDNSLRDRLLDPDRKQSAVDEAFRIRNTSHVLTRNPLKMCKANDGESVRYTDDDAVFAALKFLETLDHVEVYSFYFDPANRQIKSQGSYRIVVEGSLALDGPENDYDFAKLYLRDETSSPMALVLLEFDRTYRKADLQAAFTASMKHVEAIYVTEHLKCGGHSVSSFSWAFDQFQTLAMCLFTILILTLVAITCLVLLVSNKERCTTGKTNN